MYIVIATIVGSRLGHVFFTNGAIIHSTLQKFSKYGKEALPVTEAP